MTLGIPAAPALAADPNAANVAAAKRHFEKASADYAQGAYREAIAELEAAHTLDPNAKDLVFNLGVVHEKLEDIDEALKWFRLYTSMDLTPPERSRASAYVRRLEGAKKEIEDKRAAQGTVIPRRPTETATSKEQPPARGRIDAWTLSAAGLSVGSLVFGIVMGVSAEQSEPPANYVTGRNGTYTDLSNRVNDAHREAILADVGFGVSLLAAAATAYLYFGRTRGAKAVVHGATHVSVEPRAGGGAVFVQGLF